MTIRGIILADLHMGAIPYDIYSEELELIYEKTIESDKELNYIVIAGDYFDHRMYINDPNGNKAISWLMNFIADCSDRYKKLKIRIVYGTESHDSNQYTVFEQCNVIFPNIDLKVIKTVTEEELFEDFHVLYLPEEYLSDPDEYYKEYFNKEHFKKYHYVFGHGVVTEAMAHVIKHSDNSNTNRKRVPNFAVGDLLNICKGEIYFGHYHTRTDIDDFHYVGSFSRWRFGEEEDKGFFMTKYDDDYEVFTHKFIKNELAQRYVTYHYKRDDVAFTSSENIKESLDRIDRVNEGIDHNHVRIVFDIPEDNNNYEFYNKFIKDRYRNNKDVKISIKTNHGIKKEVDKEDIKDETESGIMKILFDKDKSMADKVSEFISIEYGKDIDSKQTKKYLDDPLNKILEV